MKIRITALALLALAAAAPAAAKGKAPQAWQATRTTDPVTGATRCVVTALDYFGKSRYSRTGFLYPVIEKHPDHGLLVGVSSGGRFRLPTGAILWRVDEKPFRELRAEDGPVTVDTAVTVPAGTQQESIAAKTMADAMALTNRMIMSATATSTFAQGERAKEMLAELLVGHGLLFRSKAAAPETGLPGTGMYRVGQITNEGLRPVPLDESLRTSLRECGMPTGE
jgi:hypothetical protein